METSVSLLEHLTGAPTDDDWRRLDELYRPLLRAWMARTGVPAADVDDLVQDVLLIVIRKIGGFEWRGQGNLSAVAQLLKVDFRCRDAEALLGNRDQGR
jgi:DNA-directed RNA polymerase specialized sigma24 family protein